MDLVKRITENIFLPIRTRTVSATAFTAGGRQVVASMIAASLLVAGCGTRHAGFTEPARRPHGPLRSAVADVYRQTERRFASAYLIKPADGSMTGLPAGDLAPLIVPEVATSGPGSGRRHAFGSLIRTAGVVLVEPSQPTVYVKTGRRKIGGRSHSVVAYCMFHTAEPSTNPCVAVTIVRAVLDPDGFPLVWEVVQSGDAGALTQGLQILYVSRSLELAAADRFGPPLPGRRHSTEPELNDAPHSVVARIIEDGPMPLGPYVYMAGDTGRVTTLHCRCSESQMDDVLESTYYELAAFDDVASEVLKRMVNSDSGDPLTAQQGQPLEEALRWPLEP